MKLTNDDWMDLIAEFMCVDSQEVRKCIELVSARLGDEREGVCGALKAMHGIVHSGASESPSTVLSRIDGVIVDLTTRIERARTFEEQEALGRQLESLMNLLARNLDDTSGVLNSLGKELTEGDVASPGTADLEPQREAKVWLMHCLGCGSLSTEPSRIRLAAGGTIDVVGVRGYGSCTHCESTDETDDNGTETILH